MSQDLTPRQLTVSELAPHVHVFLAGENKVNKISAWLIDWIKRSLKSGTVKPFDKLPSKGDLACHIGVSLGTMQNVFRYVEDCGFVESKQRIGTYIKLQDSKEIEKLTSKREIAVEAIKRHIRNGNYKIGDKLISTRKLAEMTGISSATIRIATATLISDGILSKKDKIFVIERMNFKVNNIQTRTLVEKIAEDIQEYIKMNFKVGGKLPPNQDLAQRFGVSVKTIHDSIKLLSKAGILQARRGQYGTVIAEENNKNELYYYEKVEIKIRHFIAENCQIGTKLPSILELANSFKVSAKTIKKALDNLAEDGYLTFVRGRLGGTFVTDIPQEGNEAYKWLAINPDYVAGT